MLIIEFGFWISSGLVLKKLMISGQTEILTLDSKYIILDFKCVDGIHPSLVDLFFFFLQSSVDEKVKLPMKVESGISYVSYFLTILSSIVFYLIANIHLFTTQLKCITFTFIIPIINFS